MVYLSGAAAVLVFLIAFERLGLVARAGKAVESSQAAMKVMRTPELSDEEKARALQTESLSLMSTFASIALRGVLVMALATLPMWVFELLGLATVEETSHWLLSWWAIILISAVVMAFYLLRRRA